MWVYDKLICIGNSSHAHTLKYMQSMPVLILIAAAHEGAHKQTTFLFHIYTHKKFHTNVNCTSIRLAERVNRQNY